MLALKIYHLSYHHHEADSLKKSPLWMLWSGWGCLRPLSFGLVSNIEWYPGSRGGPGLWRRRMASHSWHTEAQLSWSPTSGLIRGRHPVLCSTSCSLQARQNASDNDNGSPSHQQYFPLSTRARGVSVPPLPPQCYVLDGPQPKSARGGAVLISLALLREGGARSDLKQNKHCGTK